MPYSIRTGPIVGEHVEQCTAPNHFVALHEMKKHGLQDDLTLSRLRDLKIGEALRFDTDNNTGVSVMKIKSGSDQ